ncbi:hypothetical protein EAF00_010973 [Botryotinia globosa]|nr:hypothetical protein EAF00_010973 [Botryotinia globosa]
MDNVLHYRARGNQPQGEATSAAMRDEIQGKFGGRSRHLFRGPFTSPFSLDGKNSGLKRLVSQPAAMQEGV